MVVRLADEWFSFLPFGVIEPLHRELGLSYSETGLLLVLLSSGGVLGNFFGIAADYVSRRVLAAGGAFGYAASLLVFAQGRSLGALAVAVIAMGLSSDALVGGTEVALVDLAGDELDVVLARQNAFGELGGLLGPLTLVAAAALGLGWRFAFTLGGLLMAAYGLWLATQRLPGPPRRTEGRSPLAGVMGAARDARVWLLAAMSALLSGLDEPFLGFAIVFLRRVRAQSPTIATAMVTIAVIGGVAGYALNSAEALRGRSPASRLLWGALVMSASVAGLTIAPIISLQAVAVLCFGASVAIFWTTLQTTILRIRPGFAGTTDAVVSTGALAGLVIPVAAGRLADTAGLSASLWLFAALGGALCCLCFLFARSERNSMKSV
ncbi:MAG: MFS transporter [Actinobacteria bacterium]|nr:MFS transporter [Actinomycetota bacterium]